MSTTVNNNVVEEPLSPEGKAYIDNYTPSKEDPDVVAFVGRRNLRIANGQDPERNPEKFTPRVNPMEFKWPTDEECYAWAAEAIRASRKQENKKRKVLFPSTSPSVGSASDSSPITLEEAETVAVTSVDAVPMQPLA